jgi:hypothetical protein
MGGAKKAKKIHFRRMMVLQNTTLWFFGNHGEETPFYRIDTSRDEQPTAAFEWKRGRLVFYSAAFAAEMIFSISQSTGSLRR